MSAPKRCQECGRKLADAHFCPRCGEWFCCLACLARDNDRHLHANAISVSPRKPPGTDQRASALHTRNLSCASTS